MTQTPSSAKTATKKATTSRSTRPATSKSTGKGVKNRSASRVAGAPEAAVRKTFVLDTSVLLAAPNAMFQFAEHHVVLPLVVITELEAKRTHEYLGFQAREALRALEVLRGKGDLKTGVVVNDQGGTVRIEINHVDQAGLPDALTRSTSNDARILAVAKNLATEGAAVTVVSKDLPMRLLADTLGLGADEYLNEQVVVDRAYTGLEEVEVDAGVISDLYGNGSTEIDETFTDLDGNPIVANTGVILMAGNQKALAIVEANKTLTPINSGEEAFGVRGRSAEQKIALAHLLNPSRGVVSLGGRAGTGKTYMALAAGLEQVMEKQRYKKVIVFRNLYAVGGQELGYLPGSAEEKMSPWAAAIHDALGSMTTKECIEEIIAQDMLEILPLTHIRGRTLNDAYVIVDEAQSLEKAVLLTAMSRLGEKSKIVLSWDVAQRDNPRVGRRDGVAAVVERLKGNPLFAHTTFTRSERGPVADMVTSMLDDMIA